MSLDTYDDYNPDNPINRGELPELTELEKQEEWNMELCAKLAKMKNKIEAAKIHLQFCIDMAENGNNTLLLNNLKKIKL